MDNNLSKKRCQTINYDNTSLNFLELKMGLSLIALAVAKVRPRNGPVVS